jgi:hypothetical protein
MRRTTGIAPSSELRVTMGEAVEPKKQVAALNCEFSILNVELKGY